MLACLAAIACGGRYGEDPELETARDEPDATTTLDGAPLDVTARPLSAGMTEWIRTIDLVSAAEGDEVAIGSVAVATDGEIAIAGTFRGSIELGGHPLKSTGPSGANGYVDTFVARLTASGELRWIKSVAGRPRFRSVRIKAGPAVAFGASGEILLATEASGAVAVDGLSSRPGGSGISSFIVALDGTTGKARWLTSVVAPEASTVASIQALDARDGKVAVAGFAEGTVSVADGSDASIATPQTKGVFLGVLDDARDGRAAALLGIEGSAFDEVVGLAIAADGALVTAIRFGGPRFAGPGFAFDQVTAGNREDGLDIALVGMRPDLASAQWARSFGVARPQSTIPVGFALGSSASPLLVGSFSPSYRFDSSAPELTSAGEGDVFYGEFSSTGEPRVASAFGGTDRDEGLAIAAFANRDIVVGGRYFSSDLILAKRTLPTPSTYGAGYVFLRSASTTADWVVTYASNARADTSGVTSVATSPNRERVIASGYFTGTIDLGSEKKTSSESGARVSAFVTSIVR